MKKIGIMCVTVMCQAMRGIPSQVITALDIYMSRPEQEVERIREELKDARKLRECFNQLLLFSSGGPEAKREFKRKFGVSDEAMQKVLLGIIRESSEKTGWRQRSPSDPQDVRMADFYLREAIPWLGVCADSAGKKLLMDIAVDKAKEKEHRIGAIHAYMYRADVQEARETLTHFLADDTVASLYVYHSAVWAYSDTEGNSQKREAIVAVMTSALAQEKEQDTFIWADKMLAERSAEWAGSPQRKAALERFGKPPAPEVP